MRKGLMALMLAAVLVSACAETNSYRGRDATIEKARTCAACGASVRGDYFLGSSVKSIGPGNY